MPFLKNYTHRFYALLALTAILLIIRLGASPIYILDEAKNAQCAREMWQNGNWIIPTFNGRLRSDKPVLHYWFMITAYDLFGVSAFAARFFSTLFGIGTILMCFLWVRRHVNETAGFFTALTLAVSTHFIFEFRLSVPDPYLIFFTAAGLMCAYNYYELGKKYWLMLAAAALGLATLAKGPVALLLPGLSVLTYLLLSGQWRKLADWQLCPAAFVFLIITLPWYLAVHKATDGEWTRGFFFEHNLNRFSSRKEEHGGFFLITTIMAFIGMLPLSGLLFGVLKRKKTDQKKEPVIYFSLITAVVYLIFFSISSTKLPNYAMPAYPFIAVIIGTYCSKIVNRKEALPAYVKYLLLIFGLTISVAAYFAIKSEAAVSSLSWISLPLLVLPLGIFIALFYSRKRGISTQLGILTITWFVFNGYLVWYAYPAVYARNTMATVNNCLKNKKNLVVAYKLYNPAYNFQTKNTALPIQVFYSADSLASFSKVRKNTTDNQMLILTREEYLPELDTLKCQIILKEKDLFELPKTVLLKMNL